MTSKRRVSYTIKKKVQLNRSKTHVVLAAKPEPRSSSRSPCDHSFFRYNILLNHNILLHLQEFTQKIHELLGIHFSISKKWHPLYWYYKQFNRRVYEHKEKLIDGFTKKYNVTQLVYAEEFQDVNDAIYREKCLKNWKRAQKLFLIEEQNPDWSDLYKSIL